MNKVNGIFPIPAKTLGNFYKLWLEFIRPLHNLTSKEIEVTASILKHRYYLTQKISDPVLLDEILLNSDSRIKIKEDCNITSQYFQVMMGELRKKRVIIDGTINPKFIPLIRTGEGKFDLLLHFEWDVDK